MKPKIEHQIKNICELIAGAALVFAMFKVTMFLILIFA